MKSNSSTAQLPGMEAFPPPSGEARAEREREAAARRMREGRASVREVELHPVADPQRRERCEADPERWLRTYQPGVFYKPFDRDQRKIIAETYTRTRHGGQKIVIARRGGGKSSIFRGVQLMAFLAGLCRFAPIVGKSFQEGRANLNKQKMSLQTNPLLFEDYPEVCCFVRALGGISQRAKGMQYQGEEVWFEWQPDHLIAPQIPGSPSAGSVITAAGIDGSAIRGASFMTAAGEIIRPQAVMMDDLQNEESARSSKQVEDMIDLIHSAIGGQRGEGETMAIVGAMTIIAAEDVADRLSNRKLYPMWNGDRFKTIYAPPERLDLWNEYEEIVIRNVNDDDQDVTGGHDCEEAARFLESNFEAMHRGAELCSEYMHIPRALMKRARRAVREGDPLLAEHGGPDAWERLPFLHALAAREEIPLPLSSLHYAMNERLRLGADAFEAEFNGNPKVTHKTPLLAITPYMVQSKLGGHPRGVVPGWAERLCVGVDVGKEALHVVATAFAGRGLRGHVVEYGTRALMPVDGDARHRDSEAYRALEFAVYQALVTLREELRIQPFRNENGDPFPVDIGCVDVGFMHGAVNAFCDESPRWLSMKGFNRQELPKRGPNCMVTENLFAKRAGAGQRWRYYHNADAHKRHVHEGFRIESPRPGSLTLFGKRAVDHKDFGNQVCAEVYVEHGPGEYRWEVRDKVNPNNHYLDAAALCFAGATRLHLTVLDEVTGRVGAEPGGPEAALTEYEPAGDGPPPQQPEAQETTARGKTAGPRRRRRAQTFDL